MPSAQQMTLMGECVECGGMDGKETLGIVRANSVTLPKRQNRISRSLIFLHFSGSI
jgi:hypothetical protein